MMVSFDLVVGHRQLVVPLLADFEPRITVNVSCCVTYVSYGHSYRLDDKHNVRLELLKQHQTCKL